MSYVFFTALQNRRRVESVGDVRWAALLIPHLLVHTLLSIPRFTCVFFSAVVEGAEPAVPRHFLVAVVTFVIAMVKRMVKRTEFELSFVFDQQGFVSRVCHGSARGKVHDVIGDVDWAAGNNPVNAHGGHV